MDLTSLLALLVSSTLLYSAPLIFAALGGLFSERSGIINVGLEGIMVVGAFSSIVFNLSFAEDLGTLTPWLALIAGGICGLLFSVLHALATITLRSTHVISGTVLNLIAPSMCLVLTKLLYEDKGQTDSIVESFKLTSVPVLSDIPFIGPVFFTNIYLVPYVAIIAAVIIYFILNKTRFGLRLRSVGEHPQAADTLGINVSAYRYAGVLLSGFLGGIGGAVVAQCITRSFSVGTIAGQGFMALAALVFGKWKPISVLLSALFFGLAQCLSIVGTAVPVIKDIPSIILSIAPFIVTIVVLVIFIGKSEGPAAAGKNYIKSK